MTTVSHAHIPKSEVDAAIDAHTRSVIAVLKRAQIPLRIVGGAVRDLLQHKQPRDIDLAVDVDPAAVIYLLQAHQIDVDVGGIVHGTVKAVFGRGTQEEKVDISSIGYRIHTHGHTVSIDHSLNWEEDSALRDLTINSMSMDLDGTVYDYQNGLDDLNKQIVRMCVHATKSMALDPPSMMRYFKAASQFDAPVVVKKDLQWIKSHAYLLAATQDDKRTQMNLISALKGKNQKAALKLMCAAHINKWLPMVPCPDHTA